MPLQATSGAASYDAFGGGVPAVPNYIEDVFSTYLYTGTGAAQTITNNIDLSTKGGLVWIKDRSNAESHSLWDTARGVSAGLQSNATSAQYSDAISLTAYNSNGFSLGTDANVGWVNRSPDKYVSWSIAKAPKFFDVVTFTKSSSPQTISHSLGSTPGCIFIKRTDSTGGWLVAHRGYSGGITAGYTLLNTTAAFTSDANAVTAADSTSFTLGSSVVSGDFVAYLFAHDAGGFGLTSTDNVISCGSFTTDGSSSFTPVNLGYEPQWLMIKASSQTSNWVIVDNMRGLPVGADDARLLPNTSDAEATTFNQADISATGFGPPSGGSNPYGASQTYIYIAIRRGPMKVPTVGTSVFAPTAFTSAAGEDTISSGSVSVVDWGFVKLRTSSQIWIVGDRLRGGSYLSFDTTSAEASNVFKWDKQNAFVTDVSDSPSSFIGYSFRRAPSFFDEVCYTGTEVSGQTFNHNLGAVPEMMIVKARDGTTDWTVYHSALGASARIYLNLTNAANTGTAAPWNSTTPTSSVFSLGNAGATNLSGTKFVNYLFATCAGVSKVGSYTGTGTTLQINCGFTAGSRFVMIKRTDSTGDWYVWDTARGIVAGNDSYLLINSTAAEVTSTDYIDTYNAGFEISSTAPAAINASAGTFIFFAVS